MSLSKSAFCDGMSAEKKGKKKARYFSPSKPHAKPSPTTSRFQKRKPVTSAVPVLMIPHVSDDMEETLLGSISVIFNRDAANLREYFKGVVRYGGLIVFRFHWGANAWMNIDPNPPSSPMSPVLMCPPMPFIEAVAAACDATELVSNFRICVERRSGTCEPGREVQLADIADLNWPSESEARARAR